jgi:hypothetical protein
MSNAKYYTNCLQGLVGLNCKSNLFSGYFIEAVVPQIQFLQASIGPNSFTKHTKSFLLLPKRVPLKKQPLMQNADEKKINRSSTK